MAGLLLALGALSACRQDMHDSPRFRPYRGSDLYADGSSARPVVDGTVARGHLNEDELMFTGRVNGALSATFPFKMERADLDRGEQRFNIYCAPCHSQTGDGKGMVVCKRDKVTDPCESRGFAPLPSYEDPRLRAMPDGQVFNTITHGVRTMPAYGPQIPVADRWAIVSYVRALELSQLSMAGGAAAPTPAAPSNPPEPSK